MRAAGGVKEETPTPKTTVLSEAKSVPPPDQKAHCEWKLAAASFRGFKPFQKVPANVFVPERRRKNLSS